MQATADESLRESLKGIQSRMLLALDEAGVKRYVAGNEEPFDAALHMLPDGLTVPEV